MEYLLKSRNAESQVKTVDDLVGIKNRGKKIKIDSIIFSPGLLRSNNQLRTSRII